MLEIYCEVFDRKVQPATIKQIEQLLDTPIIDVYVYCEHWTYEDYLQSVIDEVETYELFCQLWGVEPAFDVADVLEDDALKIEFLLTHGWWEAIQ